MTPTVQLHKHNDKELDLLQVTEINKLYILKFVYKQQNGQLPEIFDSYFINNREMHQHKTRKQHKLYIVTQPTNIYGKTSMKYQGATLWNNTRDDICNSHTVKTFSKKVKYCLINEKNL